MKDFDGMRSQAENWNTPGLQLGIAIRKTGSGNPADPASLDVYRIRHQFAGSVDFGMKRQNSFDVSNPAGSRRIDGNPAGSDRIEIGAGLQSLAATHEA
ncbi:hypothetical protein AVEN_163522-1 [Araneus ventricosus]|uniref:Uncharacterized protein n=1 Tax=Araneus ventricosus TaxID=182803 RepID=A0A4Y2BPP4_ARAVE|nr:hypothetical protein AVEN_163522-1 [Araneus ventricosus]